MPELPEVEVVRLGLEKFAVGREISGVTVYHDRPLRRHIAGPRDFVDRLRGRRFLAAHRRGKYLWLPLGPSDSEEAVIAHLGMSGQFLVQPSDAPDERQLRVRFAFADGQAELRYVDQRMFGGMMLGELVGLDEGAPASGGVAAGPRPPREIAHIAPDPLDPGFDDETFAARLRRRRTGIKRALLDQSLISGVGNIYADEALWRARMHYARPTENLRRPDTARLLGALREVMGEALAAGGTSFDSLYVNVNGESGYFERALGVYGREGQPCDRCGTPIRRAPFMNRSSYTCPRCQPRPRHPRW